MTTPGSEQIDAAATRVRELNERLIGYLKAGGLSYLEAYEKNLDTLLRFEEKVAGASQVEWISALATANVDFVRQLSTSYLESARQALR